MRTTTNVYIEKFKKIIAVCLIQKSLISRVLTSIKVIMKNMITIAFTVNPFHSGYLQTGSLANKMWHFIWVFIVC